MSDGNARPEPDILDRATDVLMDATVPTGPPPELIAATGSALRERAHAAGSLIREASAPESVARPRQGIDVSRYRCSVLVLDDDPGVLSLLSAQLAAEFEIVTSSSAGEARGVLARRSVDMILSDLQLPDENGLSFLEWARRTTPRTSRIMITGAARLEDAVAAINRTQVHSLVLKPWRGEDLLQTLRSAARTLLLERSHEQLLDELRRLNLELERRVADRTRELESANARLRLMNTALEEMALTDPLTGLPNRRAIDGVVRAELTRRGRMPTPLAMVMIDADHFKQINTNHLHACGDHVLAWLAGVLKNSIRASDTVGRVGGEEFLVVAPNTDAAGATVLAERLREAVASRPAEYGDRLVPVTISLGVAVVSEGMPAAYDQLQTCAQAALKAAKEAGRNRAVVRLCVTVDANAPPVADAPGSGTHP